MRTSPGSTAALFAAALISTAAFGQAPDRGPAGPFRGLSFSSASPRVQELRRSLLERRWDYSKENREAAAAEFAAIEASGEAAPADRLLYGIVRFRQHEYVPSAALLTSALAAMPDDRLALKTRIWTATERKEFEVLWPLLSRLQRNTFALARDPAAPAGELHEDLVFLGQLHGYLAGPCRDVEREQLLATLRDEVAAGLPLKELSLFESAERDVLERHERYMRDWESLKAEVAASEKAEAEAKMAALVARREALEAQQADLDPARERVAGGSTEALNALTEAEALVANSAEAIARQAEALRIEHDHAFRAYLLQEETLRDRLRRAEELQRDNPNVVVVPPLAILNNLALLRANLVRVERRMEALQREHAGVRFQFEQIRQRRLGEEAELMRDLAKLQVDRARLEREMSRLEKEAERVDRPKRSTSLVVREAEKTLSAIESYVDFSLETPREAALAALDGR